MPRVVKSGDVLSQLFIDIDERWRRRYTWANRKAEAMRLPWAVIGVIVYRYTNFVMNLMKPIENTRKYQKYSNYTLFE